MQWEKDPLERRAALCIADFQSTSIASCAAGGPSAQEPRNLDSLDLIEDRLGSLDCELITVSLAAEILNVGIKEIRERMKSWEVVS
ncbi:MAG: hypothetical protein JXR40_00095 [Pontiellaceae bacterium]|nr:hypothetical protein [Pontiellaceae bacterium]